MPRRFFHRADENQAAIVKTLRKLGFAVEYWDKADLVCQLFGITMLCEVRPPDRPKEARKGRQAAFQAKFNVYWLQTDEDCLALYNTLKGWSHCLAQNYRG